MGEGKGNTLMHNIKCLGLSVAAPWFKDLLEDTTLNENSISQDLGRITPQNMVFVAQNRGNTASDLRNTDSSMNSSNKFKTVTHCSRVLLPCMTPFIDSQIFSIRLSYFHYKKYYQLFECLHYFSLLYSLCSCTA